MAAKGFLELPIPHVQRFQVRLFSPERYRNKPNQEDALRAMLVPHMTFKSDVPRCFQNTLVQMQVNIRRQGKIRCTTQVSHFCGLLHTCLVEI
jgi:hypothetical protein